MHTARAAALLALAGAVLALPLAPLSAAPKPDKKARTAATAPDVAPWDVAQPAVEKLDLNAYYLRAFALAFPALVGFAGDDDRLFVLAAFHDALERFQIDAGLGGLAVVALDAVLVEERLDILDKTGRRVGQRPSTRS